MKHKILAMLHEKRKTVISGQKMSEELDISRNAVWKHISALKKEGYPIESIPQKGYKLKEGEDHIYPSVLEEALGRKLRYFPTISSTNTYLKNHAKELEDQTIVISNEQTEGRGRMGRFWHSPMGEGLFVSVLLKSDLTFDKIFPLTGIAGVAIYDVVCNELGLNAQIKWPNDLLIEGKKFAGILTELAAEVDGPHHVIIGMGINVNIEAFSGDLRGVGTSLMIEKGEKIPRHDFAQALLERFFYYYDCYIKNGSLGKIRDQLKEGSCVLGHELYIIKGNEQKKVKAIDLTEEGFLIVRHKEGEIETLQSGEVSLRKVVEK